jgi:peptide/nickel transport system substrate-binding protein
MKSYIWAFLALALLSAVILRGCNRGASDAGKQESAEIEINGITYGDWTIYTIGKGTKPDDGYKNEMVTDTMSDPKTFNPPISNESSSSTAVAGCFEGLTTQDGITLQVIPALAESWDISEDHLTYAFHLRKDVKFSDGVPMTADDVIFTFNDIIFNDDIPGISMRDILTIKDKRVIVEKIDDFTVKMTMPSPFAPFTRIVGGAEIMPKHVLEQSVLDKKYSSTWTISTDPKEIIGTGPYKLTIYEKGQRLIQEANPYYWRKEFPKIGKRIILIVPNIDTSSLKFAGGETDSFGVRGEDYAYFARMSENKDFTMYDCGGTSGTLFLVFNQSVLGVPEHMQVWFRDKQFRQAVAHAVDVERIIDEVYRGMAEPLFSAEPASNKLFHNPNVKRYKYDVEKAKAILDKAGYIDSDGDGIREKPAGVPVKFILTTNSGNNTREQSCQIILNDLRAIGLDVSYTPLDFNNLVTKMDTGGEWHAMMMGLTGGVEPHFGFNVWKTDGSVHLYNQRPLEEEHEGDWNKWEKGLQEWEYKIEEIFERGVEEFDPVKRKQIYDEWQDIVAEELPYIYIATQKAVYAVRNKYKYLKPTAYGGIFHNIDTELEIVP